MFHIKQVTIATLLFATGSAAENSPGPEGIKLPLSFEYTLIASSATSTLTFQVKLPKSSWMGFGLGNSGMKGAKDEDGVVKGGVDMVQFASNKDGGVTVTDLWSQYEAQPKVDGTNDWDIILADQKAGLTEITRKMDTGKPEEDFVFECDKDYDMSVSWNDATDDISYMHTGL